MAGEVRVLNEGTLSWVAASGSGTTWATASAPNSGEFAFVQSFSYTSAAQQTPIMNRGIPDHWKQVSRDVIEVSMSCLWTGANPTAVSGDGATVPMVHLEHKSIAYEEGSDTGIYHQFYGAPNTNMQMTENAEGNTLTFTFRALAMNGPTASGYIS